MAFFTKRDLQQHWRPGGSHGYPIKIPAGTKLDWIEGGSGGYAVKGSELGKIEHEVGNLFKHDTTYYHIWVATEEVERV